MPRLLAAVGCLAAISLGGCTATFQDYRYECTQKKRTHAAWCAFAKCTPACVDDIDYKMGWKAGYYDVLTGNCGAPPVVPPKKYWKPCELTQNCNRNRNQWYTGWQDGAANAKNQPDTHYLQLWLPPGASTGHLPGPMPAAPSSVGTSGAAVLPVDLPSEPLGTAVPSLLPPAETPVRDEPETAAEPEEDATELPEATEKDTEEYAPPALEFEPTMEENDTPDADPGFDAEEEALKKKALDDLLDKARKARDEQAMRRQLRGLPPRDAAPGSRGRELERRAELLRLIGPQSAAPKAAAFPLDVTDASEPESNWTPVNPGPETAVPVEEIAASVDEKTAAAADEAAEVVIFSLDPSMMQTGAGKRRSSPGLAQPVEQMPQPATEEASLKTDARIDGLTETPAFAVPAPSPEPHVFKLSAQPAGSQGAGKRSSVYRQAGVIEQTAAEMPAP